MTSGRPVPRLPPILAVLLLSISSVAHADVSLEALMAGLRQVPSAQVRFREEKMVAVLASPLVMDGTLSYRAPGYLKKEVVHPAHSLFEINGDELLIETEEGRRTLALDRHPLLRALAESYRATLAGDRATLERYFELELTGTTERWILGLLPKDDQVRARIDQILLSGTGNRIYAVETIETSGDTTRMTIVLDDD